MAWTTFCTLASLLLATGCGGGGESVEATVAEATGAAAAEKEGLFVFTISDGAEDEEVRGPGKLRCIDLGDLGGGYLRLDNGTRTGTVAFNLPLDATEGDHSLVHWVQAAAESRAGEAYSVDVSLPLHDVSVTPDVEGSLVLEELGTQPGERIRGRFRFTSGSVEEAFTRGSPEPVVFEGHFDFIVADGARERC